jgi:hypothetical protein
MTISASAATNMDTLNSDSSDIVTMATDKTFTASQLQDDLNLMLNNIKRIHPNIYANISEKQFNELTEVTRKNINRPMTKLDFFRLITPLVATIGDAHTGAGITNSDADGYIKNGGLFFPFFISIQKGDIYVSYNLSNDSSIIKGWEIKSINGRSSQDICMALKPFFPQESERVIYSQMARSFIGYLWSVLKINDPYKIIFCKKGSNANITKTIKGITSEHLISCLQEASGRTANYSYYSLKDKTIGVIDFRTFDDKEAFTFFLDTTFTRINKDSICDLIIDVRNNPGGNSELGDELLDYLYDQPYNQFDSCSIKISPETMAQLREQAGEKDSLYIMMASKPIGSLVPFPIPQSARRKEKRNKYTGNVYLLISNFSGSSAVSFAAAFKKYKVGKIVGQETGGLTYTFGDCYFFELPCSKLGCTVSTKIINCAGGKNDGHGVLPDYPIAVNPENNQKDPEIEFVLKLIQDRK